MIASLRPGIRRHALLRIDPACWSRIIARAGDAAGTAETVLGRWAARGWPVIVRRYLPGEPHSATPVAVSLPPRPLRSGVTLRVLADEIEKADPALPLTAAVAQAPASWRRTMRMLAQIGEQCGCQPALCGSLLWQTLTGMTYLTARSDLDVCWQVGCERQAQSLVNELARIERSSPVRIDGELLLPDGAGVSWREFAERSGDGDELLVKTLYAVTSRSRASLFARAEAA